ncbi:MAG: GDP-perosamine synthase [Alphaproteobacteria bacterium MarineAlpha5_Bin11]|nr:MAG: GDP-perosamine synthase [Alphaproteobacteria bacterium MarineAlpha5_Bin11]
MKSKKKIKNLIKPIFNPNGKFNGKELEYVMEYLNTENSKTNNKTWSEKLEKAFCKKFNMKYAIGHNSGTSTLHSCLYAADVGAGDEVIMPTYTVICLAFAALHQNAVPVFVDSDLDNFNMDPDLIEEKITKKTKAIIVVHMHGVPAKMNEIMKIAKKYKLIVIEDCAQSLLSKYKGRLTGTIGHMSSFSFETKKQITSGQGGIVLTSNKIFAERIRKHAGLGYKILKAEAGVGSLLPRQFQNPDFKRHDSLGYNYRIPEICAALALAQFERSKKLTDRRNIIASMYLDALRACDWIVPQKSPTNCYNSHWSFAVKYYGKEKYNFSWRKFYDLFNKNGGDSFFGAVSLQHLEDVMLKKPFLGKYIPKNNIYKNKFNYGIGTCPVAESIQPLIMVFKCGYRDMRIARKSLNALKKTINQIEKQCKKNNDH